MKEKIIIDIGSSTVKIYKQALNKVSPLLFRSIVFKDDFSISKGISEKAKEELFELIEEIKRQHSEALIRIFATAIFRKSDDSVRKNFIDEFFIRTGLYFNIITQELESFYLQTALIGKYHSDELVLLINIGGASSELIIMYGREAIELINLDFGVGTIISEFPNINNDNTIVVLSEIIEFVKSKLPISKNKATIAIYSGGELNYMRLAGYKLGKNTFFDDEKHPLMIAIDDFKKRNKEIFTDITVKELENFMPNNPKWMHGARACSIIAQAICEKYGINIIIPSDSNLAHGVIQQEFRRVTISGSFRKHLDYILKVRKKLIEQGVEILSPRFTEPKNPGEEFVVFDGEEGITPLELERHHLHSIELSDALIVCCPGGYVGASALIEIGYANALNKKIVFTEKPEEFMLNTFPAEIGL